MAIPGPPPDIDFDDEPMLTQQEIIRKVYQLYDRFIWGLRNNRGRLATAAYYEAIEIACFCRFPKEERLKLFGDTTLDPPVEGLFTTEDVIKAGDMADHETYEHFLKKDEPIERFNIRYIYL